MTTKTYDRQRGTWIYDSGDFRAIVYKLGDRWACRAGPKQSNMIAPVSEVFETYRKRHEAERQALDYLGE